MMKKFLTLIMLLALFIAGCGSDAAPKICQTAGLGDSKQAWIDDHGEPNRDGDELAIIGFDNDKYLVSFLEGKAINITFQKNNTKRNPLLKEMIPTDSKLISTEDVSDDVLINTKETYTSESLKNAVKVSGGTFYIYHTFDKKTGNYLHSVIGSEIKS